MRAKKFCLRWILNAENEKRVHKELRITYTMKGIIRVGRIRALKSFCFTLIPQNILLVSPSPAILT